MDEERDRTIQALREDIAKLNVVTLELRAGLCAALVYLRAQPSYDAALMARLHDEEIEKLGIGPGDSRSRLESLLATLRTHEGDPQ